MLAPRFTNRMAAKLAMVHRKYAHAAPLCPHICLLFIPYAFFGGHGNAACADKPMGRSVVKAVHTYMHKPVDLRTLEFYS